jgi:hypothetical protein
VLWQPDGKFPEHRLGVVEQGDGLFSFPGLPIEADIEGNGKGSPPWRDGTPGRAGYTAEPGRTRCRGWWSGRHPGGSVPFILCPVFLWVVLSMDSKSPFKLSHGLEARETVRVGSERGLSGSGGSVSGLDVAEDLGYIGGRPCRIRGNATVPRRRHSPLWRLVIRKRAIPPPLNAFHG